MGSAVDEVTRYAGKTVTSLLGIERPNLPAAVQQTLDAPPAGEPEKAMPLPDDAAARAARRRSAAEQRRRRGRQSTILTAADEPLGG